MAAMGLGGSWGARTENDPNRSVERVALPQSLASRFHYQDKLSAQDVLTMPEEQWNSINRGGVATRDDVADYMRAYEHYQ